MVGDSENEDDEKRDANQFNDCLISEKTKAKSLNEKVAGR